MRESREHQADEVRYRAEKNLPVENSLLLVIYDAQLVQLITWEM